jgi:NADH:ubiquinone oxidoreductase subunit H
MSPGFGAALWYVGRFLQLLAMWILLVDIFMAGPSGPQPNPFYIGIVMFLIGWFIVRATSQKQ